MEHREQTLLSPTASTLLLSSKNVPSTSVSHQVPTSASSSFGTHLAPPGLVSGSQELTVLQPLHNRAQESTISSGHGIATESTSDGTFALPIGARYATTPVARGKNLLEGEVGIRSSLDLNQTASHQEKIAIAKSGTGANTFEGHTIQEDSQSRLQSSSILSTSRKPSSHQGCSTSPASLRAANTFEVHSLQEIVSPQSQPPSTYSTVLSRQKALASATSSGALGSLESRGIENHIPLRSNSKAPFHRENAFTSKANPFEAHSLRNPVLRSEPPSSDPVSFYALSLVLTHS